MRNDFKARVTRTFSLSTTLLSCISIFFITAFFISNNKSHIIDILYKNEIFIFLGIASIVFLVARIVVITGIPCKLERWIKNNRRKQRTWPAIEEEILLESLFYEGINFYELHKFVQWAYDISYIAYTENSNATLKNYCLLARDETEKYWYSYFRVLYRETERIRMLSPLVSHFMATLTDDTIYQEELKDQSKLDPELKNIEVEKLLIAILDKEKVLKYYDLCYKYYRMMIEKKIEKEIAL